MNRLSVFIIVLAISPGLRAQSTTDFVKRWNIEGYIYLGMTFSPEEKEQDDYIRFFEDGTFLSMEESKVEEGSWEWKADERSLYFREGTEFISVKVDKVKADELILLLEEDGESIKVKYKAATDNK